MLMRSLILYPLMEHELYWWFVLVFFAVSLFIGTTITNYFYRNTSWSSLILYDFWNYVGARGTGFELYLFNIGVITPVILAVLDGCIIYWLKGFQ